jgi:hypothetical protein
MSLQPSNSFLKVIGLLAIFTLVPGSLYLMYYRTGGPASQKELAFQKNVRYAFMQGTETVDLAPLTTWGWKKVCALDSNITADDVATVIGFPYKDFEQLYWMHQPTVWTLLFIDSEREANWGPATPIVPIRIPRKEVAQLALPEGAKGACTDRETGGLILSRQVESPVGISPITVRLGTRTLSTGTPPQGAN